MDQFTFLNVQPIKCKYMERRYFCIYTQLIQPDSSFISIKFTFITPQPNTIAKNNSKNIREISNKQHTITSQNTQTMLCINTFQIIIGRAFYLIEFWCLFHSNGKKIVDIELMLYRVLIVSLNGEPLAVILLNYANRQTDSGA